LAQEQWQACSYPSLLWVNRVGFVMSAVCPVYPN
jgi:hypothetical protein